MSDVEFQAILNKGADMKGLSLHCGANVATYDQVAEVLTPEPTASHFPIPHAFLIDRVREQVEREGLHVRESAHGLTEGGARYFGLMELDQPSDDGNGYGLVLGLRNTHDKRWSAALALGNRVFVCDNLCFSGEVLIGRKHTRHIERDIPQLLPRAFQALSHERVCMEQRISAYKKMWLEDTRAESLILRAAFDENAIGKRDMARVLKEWRGPAHESFQDRTLWSLFNAFTEVAKPRQVQTEEGMEVQSHDLNMVSRRSRRLFGLFDRVIGLNLPSREEVMARGEGFLALN